MTTEATIVVCMGSSCFARGNRHNLRLIEQFITENKLEARIAVSGSRCEEQCAEGPNIIINGKIYHQVDGGALIDLLNQHFLQE